MDINKIFYAMIIIYISITTLFNMYSTKAENIWLQKKKKIKKIQSRENGQILLLDEKN
jgi:hypothetical protein